jgi:hypothetical protein
MSTHPVRPVHERAVEYAVEHEVCMCAQPEPSDWGSDYCKGCKRVIDEEAYDDFMDVSADGRVDVYGSLQ